MSKIRENAETEPKVREGSDAMSDGDDDQGPDVEVSKNESGQHVVSGQLDGKSRRERRQEEQAERIRKAIEEQNRPFHERLSQFERTIQNLGQLLQQQRPSQGPYVPPGTPPADADEWTAKTERQEELIESMRNAKTPEALQKHRGEYLRLEKEKQVLVAEQVAKKSQEAFAKANPPQESYEVRTLKQEFADVLGDDSAREYAWGLFQQTRAKANRERRVFNEFEGHRASLTQAAHDLGIRQRPSARPSDAQRARFSSPTPNSTSSSGGFSRPLTKVEERVAVAWAGPSVERETAIAGWTKMMLKQDPNYFKDQ
jgi:hypothetical protein